MIPKVIHYCWFGGKQLPETAVKCINSWKKYCPDYEIRQWNEDNVEVMNCPKYIADAYSARKYAFVSDYVRLKVLYEYGGFYMDTDVELVNSLDVLLGNRAVIGFENDEFVNSGQLLAAEAGHPILMEMMEKYKHIEFYQVDGGVYLLGCPHINTEVLVSHGLEKNGQEQIVSDVHVYPADWFNPLDSTTGVLHKTNNTISIHWYSMSWIPKWKQVRVRLMRQIRRLTKYDR